MPSEHRRSRRTECSTLVAIVVVLLFVVQPIQSLGVPTAAQAAGHESELNGETGVDPDPHRSDRPTGASARAPSTDRPARRDRDASAPDHQGLPDAATLRNRPVQPASLAYSGDTSRLSEYAEPGALVVAGRDNYQDRTFKQVSASGGTVLIYLNVMIDLTHGRYHDLLIRRSELGPAVPRWPGVPAANEWGYLNDIRPTGTLQRKLEGVLELMVAENPHMAGWFVDDVGSRSWYGGHDWDSWPAARQQEYRDGAIAITKTLRRVADRHGLIFIVNGTWGGGSVERNGGGYPDLTQHGNALADGGFVEHHDGGLEYFGPYACSDQWASQSSVTHGRAFNYAVTSSAGERARYAASGCYSHVNQQPTDTYDYAAPWGGFHPTGLPSAVR